MVQGYPVSTQLKRMELRYAGSRGRYKEVIIEEFVKFDRKNIAYRNAKNGQHYFVHLLATGRNAAIIWKAGSPVQ